MLAYIAKRVFQIIPVLIGATLLLFVIVYVIPGDPVRLMTGQRTMDPARYQEIRRQLNLDKPVYVQYFLYLKDLAKGDFGTSYQKGRPVVDILKDGYPNSLKLALVAITIEALLGIVAGVISAVRRYSFADVLVTLSTSVLVTVPVFWLGMILQQIFGVWLHWLPVSGYGDGGPLNYVLPATTLAAISTAYVARIMRSQMLEVMDQDYIRTAYAKGLRRKSVIYKHALKNALIPVVTYIGLDLGVLIGSAIVTETIFSWPGIGYEIYLAVLQRDNPVILGGVTTLVILFMLINLLIDISYAFLDPRIRYGRAGS
ncbi:MAG: ABC transporter permease [Actinobacteria bacterium]|nr:ABC transporter permease [Actinomycetota bacterium]